MPKPPARTQAIDGDELFLAWLERVEGGVAESFDDLCDRHPEHRRGFRRLRADWEFVESRSPPARERESSGRATRASTNKERYRDLGVIAEGGMGVVHRVWDGDMQRTVAMKIARGPRVESGSAVPPLSRRSLARFLKEAQVAGRLDHPGVVPIHERGVDDSGRAFFTMQLVEGSELGEIFALARRKEEGWSLTRALGVLMRVCETMAFVHDRGVIHRDLKPANVLVGRFGETYVVDWGLAKAIDEDGAPWPDDLAESESALVTAPGTVIGTPSYMAPEQADAGTGQVGPRSDGYAIGAMLYELLAGRPPYGGDRSSTREVLAALRAGPPTQLGSLARSCPRELAAICEKAMARDPKDRYATCLEMNEDLNAFLDRRVVAAYRTGPLVELSKWVARNKLTAGAVGLTITTVLGGAISIGVTEARARRAIELESYVASLNAADAALRIDDVTSARTHLARAPAHLRAWEWRHLSSRLDQSLLTLEGHAKTVWSVEFDASGERLVTASMDGTARIWDVATGECLLSLGHEDSVRSAVFVTDGELVLTASGSAAHLWDVSSGARVRSLAGHTDKVQSIAVDPRGLRAATSSADKTVRVWELSTGRELARLVGHAQAVLSVDFDGGGSRLVSGGVDGGVRVWDADDGACLMSTRAPAKVTRVCFSPDGKTVLTSSDAVRVVNADTGAIVAVWDGRGGRGAGSGIFHPSGDRILVVGLDYSTRLWDPVGDEFGEPLLGHDALVVSTAFSPDGRSFATGDYSGAVKLWRVDVDGGIPVLRDHRGYVYDVECDPRGGRVASTGHSYTVRLWDRLTGALLATHFTVYGAYGLAYSPDGDTLALAERDGSVTLLDSDTFEVLGSTSTDGAKRCIAWHPDGRFVVAATDSSAKDMEVSIFDIETFRVTAFLDPYDARVHSIAFSPDGRVVAIGSDHPFIELVSFPSSKRMKRLVGHSGAVRGVAFAPDGGLLASASEDGTVRLWSLSSGSEVAVLEGHGAGVCAIDFSPDGKRLVSASDDRDLIVWNVETRRELLRLRGHEWSVLAIDWSADGELIASGSWGKTVRLWDTVPASEREAARSAANAAEKRVKPIVDAHYERGGSLNDVLSALESDSSLDAELVPVAIRLARARHDDPEARVVRVREVLWSAGRSEEEYRRASIEAEWAFSNDESDPELQVLWGAASLRVGDASHALTRLQHFAESEDRADALAFLALAHIALGNGEQARALLARAESCVVDDASRGLIEEARSRLTVAGPDER